MTSRYGLDEVIYQQQVVNKIDFSDLSDLDQQGFAKWLDEQFYMKLGLVTALQRGLQIKVGRQKPATPTTPGGSYTVRIGGCSSK
ncbi:hypothetical protein [Spirosoma arcticum]